MVPESDARVPAPPPWPAVEAAPRVPRRSPSPVPAILVMLSGIALSVVLGLTVGARLGALTIAATLAVAGTWRAVSRSGPPGLAVRSRGFDVGLCWTTAIVMGTLAVTVPDV